MAGLWRRFISTSCMTSRLYSLILSWLQIPTIRQMIKFNIIGLSNFILDFSVYYFLTRDFAFWQHYYVLANAVSFAVAVTWSFFWNKYWTFRAGGRSYKQYVKFFTVYLISLMLSTLLLYWTVEYWHWLDLISKFVIAMVVMFWNFFMNKYWAFVGSNKSE